MESVSGLIYNEKKEILLIKRRDVPVWALPGGGIEEGESPDLALLREIEEETGLKVRIQKKLAEYTPLNRLAKFTHFYSCIPISGELTTGDETQAIAFFHPSKLPKKLPPPFHDWIEDALSFPTHILKKPITSVTYRALFKNCLLHPLLVMRFLLARLGHPVNS